MLFWLSIVSCLRTLFSYLKVYIYFEHKLESLDYKFIGYIYCNFLNFYDPKSII
jgi:hypothetical protein